jgi:hypothetical protein
MTRELAMARNNLLLLVSFIVLPVVVLVGSYLLRGVETVKLAGPVNTVMAGQPYADQLRDKAAPAAVLTGVVVDLDPIDAGFKTRAVTFGYRLEDKKQTLLVTVDNASGTAYPIQVADPERMTVPAMAFQPLDLAKVSIDVPQVLAIASTNDLATFCDMVPLAERSVDLRLGSGEKGPEWSVVGDGWTNKTPIADLNIQINATTGEVIKHSLTKAAGRP